MAKKRKITEFPSIPDLPEGSSAATFSANNPFDTKNVARGAVRNPQIVNAARAYQAILGPVKSPGIDFTDLQEAVNSVSDRGGGTIILTPGVYPMPETVFLKQDVSIEGISTQRSVLDFSQMIEYTGSEFATGGGLIGEGTLRENSGIGTIAITSDSKTVTGTSTAFGSVTKGDNLIVAGIPYKIDSVASGTSLTLEKAYRGKTISGEDYEIYAPIVNISISKLTVKEGIGVGIGFVRAQNISIEDVTSSGWRQTSGNLGFGVRQSDCYQLFMKNVSALDNESHGIFSEVNRAQYLSFITAANNEGDGVRLEGSDDTFLTHTIASNNGANGVYLKESERSRVEVVRAEGNVSRGFYLTGDSSDSLLTSCADNMIVNCIARDNGSDGIKIFDEVSDVGFGQTADIITRNSLVANTLIDNGGYGINIDFETGVGGEDNSGLTDNSIRGGNSFSGNTSGKVNDNGSNTKIATGFVAKDDPVALVSGADPSGTTFTEVDCTAATSADCYAVAVHIFMKSDTTAARYLKIRKNGDATNDTTLWRVNNPVVAQYGHGTVVTAVDTGQIFEYGASHTDVNDLYITLTGFFERTY